MVIKLRDKYANLKYYFVLNSSKEKTIDPYRICLSYLCNAM